MSDRNHRFIAKTALIAAAALVLSPLGALAQSTAAPGKLQPINDIRTQAGAARRVIRSDAKGETVRVNVPPSWPKKFSQPSQDRLHARQSEN